jgi:hypothetical protein
MTIKRVSAALVLLVIAFAANAQPVTALRLQEDPGYLNGTGGLYVYQTPANTFDVTIFEGGEVNVVIDGATANYVDLVFGRERDLPLSVGVAEVTTRGGPGTPWLSAYSVRAGLCTHEVGRFVVLEYVRTGNTVTSLAVNFQLWCRGTLPMASGELRINSAVPFSDQRAAGWTTPDAFALRARDMLAPSAQVISNEIVVNGINANSAISVAGGEYSVNGGPFTATSGTVANHARVRVRANAPSLQSQSSVANLSIGGVQASFNLSTYSVGANATGLYVRSMPGDIIGGGVTRFESGTDSWFRTYAINGSVVQIDDADGDFSSLTLAARGPVRPPPGPYEEALRWTNPASPTVNYVRKGSGCNTIAGRFVVLEAEYDGAGVPTRLAANFEQHCDSPTAAPLYGEIRFNSPVPFSFMVPSGDSNPDPFALAAQSPVRAGAVVVSNTITVYGTNAQSPISIVGGEYSVNGGAFTTASGVVQPLDHVVVRMTASQRAGEVRQAALTIGNQTATLVVETYRPGMVLSGVYARDPSGMLNAGTRLLLAPRNPMTARTEAGGYLETMSFAMSGMPASASFFGPGGALVAPGVYPRSVSDPAKLRALYGALWSDYCDGKPGTVVVHEAVYGTGGTVVRFAADVTQGCEGLAAPAYAEIRVNSVVPFSALAQPAPNSTDFGADGKSDLVYQNTDGRIAASTMDGATALATANLIGAGAGWQVTHVADLDGDRKADIFFKHTDGRIYVYRMDGLTVIAGKELFGAGLGWSISHTADLNGDGKADLILRHADGRAHIWLMDGTAIIGSATLLPASSGWTVVGTGDLNGDGKADLVFTHTDGRGYIYLMNGTVITGSAGFLSQGSGWVVSHVADFDGDGKADLLFRHVDGSAYLFLMNGTTFGPGVSVLGGGTGWTVTHVGDLNGDGKADLVFRHTDGRAHARLMNGTATLNAGDVLPAASGWRVTQLLDFNGDGKKDLVFHHDNGSITVRLMNGLTTIGSANLIGPGGWSVAP